MSSARVGNPGRAKKRRTNPPRPVAYLMSLDGRTMFEVKSAPAFQGPSGSAFVSAFLSLRREEKDRLLLVFAEQASRAKGACEDIVAISERLKAMKRAREARR